MNFQGKAVLVYLEEDNITRAYFRIQPLLTQDGPVGEMQSAYPDDGYLRIVPDKNEQHTFKDRMRAMCGLCVMDLRFQPAEANKIRTNKNYSPSRGETNQYIIYSDAVRAMPDDLLYQVVSEGNLHAAVTPRVYIRNGANIQGPFLRENGQPAGDTVQLPPDSAEIHAVTVNGQDLLFYWPKTGEAPAIEKPAEAEAEAVPEAPAAPVAEEKTAEQAPQQNAYEQIQSMNVAPSAHANRLHDDVPRPVMDYMPEQSQKPLTGTRLYQAPQRQVSPRRAHNPLMEAVENQRYAARYEAPGATLPQSAELREVHNPADALKRALQGMWQSTETQRQAVDVLLNQPGMRALLSKALSRDTNDLTIAAMQTQLQELEAERLMTLMQLDDVKKNLAAAREDALGQMNMAEQKKLDELHIAQQKAQNALDEITQAIAPIEQKRQALAERMQEAEGVLEAAPHFVSPRAGEAVNRDELIRRTEDCLKAAGFAVEAGDALSMLTAFALAEGEWECCCASEEDAQTALEAFAAALGVQLENTGYKSDVVLLPGGSAPVLLNIRYACSPLVTSSYTQTFAARCGENAAVTVPSVPLYGNMDALPAALPHFSPVSKESIVKEMIAETPLTDETQAVITALRKAAGACPIPLRYVRQACRFIASTQNDLKGGVAEAIDRAVCLFFVPHLLGCGIDRETILPLLAAMPRALKALNA